MRAAFIAVAVAAILVAWSPARADADGIEVDFVVSSVPEVSDASSVVAMAVEDGVTAALDPTLFVDANGGETEVLIAQDLASLRVETTGSLPATTEAHLAEEIGPSDGTDVLP